MPDRDGKVGNHPHDCYCDQCKADRRKRYEAAKSSFSKWEPAGSDSTGNGDMWIGLTIIGVVLLIAGGAVWFIFFNESGSNAHEENIAIVEGDTPPQVPSPVVERSKETESAPAPKIIPLESELPQVVFDEFHDDWYDRCDSPQQSELKIVRSWNGVGPGEIDITPPADSYFLVVRGSPSAAT